jgi:hypothetical protein
MPSRLQALLDLLYEHEDRGSNLFPDASKFPTELKNYFRTKKHLLFVITAL